jgi:DNA-binding CsgD family transcriptional regulator
MVLPGHDHLPWIGDWAAVVTQVLAFLPAVTPRHRRSPVRPPGERSPRRPGVGWPSLSPAERDVVRLVVEGLSNRDVAERLFLSRYTVETHLKHVFAKLGVESRTQLATLAGSQGTGGIT